QTIDKMNPNDPPSYMPDLIAAETALIHSDAKIKHVILLGDGDATDSYEKQVLKMASENISVSVVGTNIGSYDDLTMMQQIAAWGKGRFYQANNPNTIPQILLNETKQAAKRAFIEEPFVPAIITPHPILTGLGSLPQLTGYVATTPKPTAQIVLTSHLDDPVLAVWQYGLGRVVAWTSDALGLWTANWLQWSDAARWWANLVTWTISTPNNQLIVNSEIVGGNGHIIVDIPPETSAISGSVNQQQVQVKIIAPDLSQQAIALQPTAPERWEGTFPTTQVGAYLLRVTWQARSSATNGSPSQLTTTTGLVVPYSPEFATYGTDTRFLNQLAHAGDGSVLNPNDTASAFSTNLPRVYASLSIVFWLFAIAALLLPVDIALRRLSSLESLVVGYYWLLSHLGLRNATRAKDTPDNLVLDTIRSNREERRSRASSRKPKVVTIATKPAIKSATLDSKKQQDVSTTEKLLEAKRMRSITKTDAE
ncbi:MAG TPA: glutamine amidotransferase, partial [Ktedonobacteraceae bacterium]